MKAPSPCGWGFQRNQQIKRSNLLEAGDDADLFRDIAHIRTHLPITLSTSEPEPNIAVVRIDANEYAARHPAAEDIFLLIEISYTTLEIDRSEKALIYARANIADYWVLDVSEKQVYIFRNPTNSGYQKETVLNANSVIALLAFPEIEIPFSELFLP